jgi:3-dehydrosphinganine reductase
MKLSNVEGKNAYVVGGSMGIGLAAARKLAGGGADVLLFARRREPLVEATAEVERCRSRPGQRVSWRQLDAADVEAVERVMGEAVVELGAPDLLINCAGGASPNYFARISQAQLASTMRRNLDTCWNTVSALLPHMQRRGSGYIVNVSSLAGLIGVFGYTDYCAAKFAVIGFSEALRSELRPLGIGVSVLCPPDTLTPGLEQENEYKPVETRAVSAAASVLTADAVADALLAGLRKGKFLIVAGRMGRVSLFAQRFTPWLVRMAIDYQVRRAQRGRK